jgi:hypothetical protein
MSSFLPSFFKSDTTALLLSQTRPDLVPVYLNQFTQENLYESLSACCFDIQPDYLQGCVNKLVSNPQENDIVCLTKQDDMAIQAFMIVELGECQMLPNVFSIKLICAKKGTKGLGGLLIGNYLANLAAKAEYIGVLELANSYINTSGLCLYEKFGFRYDIQYVGTTCYPNYGATTKNVMRGVYDNLPMFVDLRIFIPNGVDALTYIVGVINNTIKTDKPEVCTILNPMYQQIYALLEEIKRVAIITERENENYNKRKKTETGLTIRKSTIKKNLENSVSHKYFGAIFEYIDLRKPETMDMVLYLTTLQQYVKSKYLNIDFIPPVYEGRKSQFVSQLDIDLYKEVLNYLIEIHCERSPNDCPKVEGTQSATNTARPIARGIRTLLRRTIAQGGGLKKRTKKKSTRKHKGRRNKRYTRAKK